MITGFLIFNLPLSNAQISTSKNFRATSVNLNEKINTEKHLIAAYSQRGLIPKQQHQLKNRAGLTFIPIGTSYNLYSMYIQSREQ